MNMIQLLIMVHNPRKLVSEISRLVQLVIDEMIPSLGFLPAVERGGVVFWCHCRDSSNRQEALGGCLVLAGRDGPDGSLTQGDQRLEFSDAPTQGGGVRLGQGVVVVADAGCRETVFEVRLQPDP